MSDDLVNELTRADGIVAVTKETVVALIGEIGRLEAKAKQDAARIEALEAENARLQRALSFWMPGVDSRLDEATRGLAADDALLLAGYTDQDDDACWGNGMIARAEKAESALAEAGWHTFADQPASGRKFIALYNDGSGASMFFAFDGGVIDSDGDELYDWFSSDHSYDRWAYLPDNLEFWCEVRAEDPVSLSPARAFVQQHEGKK